MKYFLLAFIFISSQIATTQDLPADIKSELTSHLETLSGDWIQASVDRTNDIFESYKYIGTEYWEKFFIEYFQEHDFTVPLHTYIYYPAFWWLSDAVHDNLQYGLVAGISHLQTRYLDMLEPGEVTENLDQSIRATFRIMHQFCTEMNSNPDVRDISIDNLLDLPDVYPHFFKKDRQVDLETFPYIGQIKVQLNATLASYYFIHGQRHDAIKNALGLDQGSNGWYTRLWDDFGILISDNGLFNEDQLRIIYEFCSLIPQHLQKPVEISSTSVLNENYHGRLSKASINIFPDVPGTISGNTFASDVEPYLSDFYSIVVAHEFNHIVDYFASERNIEFGSRKEELIDRAGSNPLHYLRDLPESFFLDSPQEFIASIANSYFSNSGHLMQLALSRFENGITHPLDHFLLFVDLYSNGSDQSFFYEIDEMGNLKRYEVTLRRNGSNGGDNLISGLFWKEVWYYFYYDEQGFIMDVGREETSLGERVHSIVSVVNGVKQFPNPTQGVIYFTFERPIEKGRYSIMSFEGKVIREGTIEFRDELCLDLDGPPGLYVVLIQDEGSAWSDQWTISKISR